MTRFYPNKGLLSLCILIALTSARLSAQQVTASPQSLIRPIGPNTVTVALDRVAGNWGNTGNYVWTVSPSNGVTIGSYSQTNPNVGDVNVTFSAAANGTYTFTLTRGAIVGSVQVSVGNIAATSSTGGIVSVFSVSNGAYLAGPGTVFNTITPSSALGLSQNGFYYYLPNAYNGNDGNVTVYGANSNGGGGTALGSVDLNGGSSNDLGFVRLAIAPNGVGWILAGDNTQVYLGSFVANGLNPISITQVDPSVTLVNGNVSTFFNGDICFSGSGTLFALANSGTGGTTQIFTGTPNGANTTLSKKWDLVDPSGNPFSGSVNGCAFDLLGSLYISTSTGLYYINQQTVNTATGTVQCALVRNVTGLTDLASNTYPQLTTLPVNLITFAVTYRNESSLLSWETESERNFDHFEIERTKDGSSFETVGNKPGNPNTSGRQQYQYNDNLAAVNGTVFTYRLKLVDLDGQFKYSRVLMVRKDAGGVKGIQLSPTPVQNGTATVRFTTSRIGNASLRVVDLSGKTVLQQSAKVFDGTNSIPLYNTESLHSGTYVLQVIQDGEVSTLKFVVAK